MAYINTLGWSTSLLTPSYKYDIYIASIRARARKAGPREARSREARSREARAREAKLGLGLG